MKQLILLLLIVFLIGCSPTPPRHWDVQLSHEYLEDTLQLKATITNISNKPLTLVSAHFVVPDNDENFLVGKEINKVVESNSHYNIEIFISETDSFSNEAPLQFKNLSQLKLKIKWLDKQTQYIRKFP